MVDYSAYPSSIDTSTQIPLTVDLVSSVKAEIINRLRSAIIHVEQELGINPSGVYSTVKDRLDALEAGGVGGGGGSGTVSVSLDSSVVSPQTTSFNFEGDFNVAVGAPHEVIISTASNSTNQIQEQIAVTNGQTEIELSYTPLTPSAVQFYINGLKQSLLNDFIVAGKTVVYGGELTLSSSDTCEFWYLTSLGTTAVPISQNIAVSNGQTSLTLSSTPAQPTAVQFFVNGEKIAIADYSVSGTTLTYTGSPALASTDKVDLHYLILSNSVVSDTGSLTNIFAITTIKTSVYTADYNQLVRVDPSGAGFNVNLPAASGHPGQSITVKNVTSSTNTVSLIPFGAETIDDDTSFDINIGFQSVTVLSNGTVWMAI